MRCVSIGLAVCGLVSGLVAAFYWYQSSIVKVDPGWTENPEPVVPDLRQMAWNSAVLTAITKSADLNKTASLRTALTVALGGAASIIGSLA
jgi:hypothetical protein